MHNLGTLGVPPPADPRNRVESGQFLRALLTRWLMVSIVSWALILLVTDLPSWFYFAGAVVLVTLALDWLWLTYRVRRDQDRAARG